MEQIGIIGLGNMGIAIAAQLVEAGKQVAVLDLQNERMQQAVGFGARPAEDLTDLTRTSQALLLVLPGPEQVKSVIDGLGGLAAGTEERITVVDMTTSDPSVSREAERKCAEIGHRYCDAPVLGRPKGCGNWTVPVGCPNETFRAVEPLLQVLAKSVTHMGPCGTAHAFKLINNLMLGGLNTVIGEVFAICDAVCIDRKVFADTVSESGAASVSNLFLEMAPRISDSDFTPVFALDLMYKDMALGIKMAEDAGAVPVVSDCHQQINAIGRAQGYGEQDCSSIVKVFQMLNGMTRG